MSFLIVTGPVRSGKTTALSDWLRRYNRAGGLLTPDGADGLRLFYDVAADRFLPFEVSSQDATSPNSQQTIGTPRNFFSRNDEKKYPGPPADKSIRSDKQEAPDIFLPFDSAQGSKNSGDSTEELVEVGRFRFWKSSFDHGNDLLLKASETDYDVVALDEWGKLELRGKGFAGGAEHVVKKALSGALNADLIVVVRDYLLDDFYAWCKSLIPAEEVLCSPKILDLPTG